MVLGKNVILKNNKNKQLILNNVSFENLDKNITVFIGKSGAGKTTLLKCIANLIQDYEGKIIVDGIDLRKYSNEENAKRIGFVFQDFNLFPTMTVVENCMDPLIIRGISKEKAKQKALEYLSFLGMNQQQESYPFSLSGGQQQRVALARALSLEPNVLIFDEPTSALDPQNTTEFINILQKLIKKGVSIILSSQDMTFVRIIAQRVYLMENGRIVAMIDKSNKENGDIDLLLKKIGSFS